jgi:Dolichyl-phosphate-mannose-protein mannosyltransferase
MKKLLVKLEAGTERRIFIALLAFYIALRVVVFHYSDNGIDFHHNAYDRGIFVQNWMQDFRLVPDVSYGPVHFYLVGAVMLILPDPVLAPRLLALICSIVVFVLIYKLTRRLYGPWEAIVAGILAAAHPHGVRLSVVGLEMMPYAMILIGAFLALHYFWTSDRKFALAALAGLLFTLAAATRFEAWIVLPIVCVAALIKEWKSGLVFCVAASIFPAAWMGYHFHLYGEPFHFLGIAGNIAGVHMQKLPLWQRALGWPIILVKYAPLPTCLLALVGFVTAWSNKAIRPLLLGAGLTFAIFETQTIRGVMGTNETKYVMPLVLMVIPQAAQEVTRRIDGHQVLRGIIIFMSCVMLILVPVRIIRDGRAFAAPKGAKEQAAFLAKLPADAKVMIGTSLQGYLLVEGDLMSRAVLPYPEDTTGRMSAERIAGFVKDSPVRFVAYQYDDPVDFAPLMKLPADADNAQWKGFNFQRVFLSVDGKFAVYEVL